MKLLVVAVALLVVAVNSESDECGPQERVKVKRQWNEMFCGDISERMQLGQDIYNTLFADYPVVMPLFDGVNGNDTSSPEFKAHSQRVLRGFDVSINLLYNPDILAEELDHLKVQHAPMGINPEYYDALIEVLLEVLPDYVGPNFDDGAWNACLHVIADGVMS